MSLRRIILLISFFLLMSLIGLAVLLFGTNLLIKHNPMPNKALPTQNTVHVQQVPTVSEPTSTPIVIYPAPTPPIPQTSDVFYTVEPGETLSGIAYKFNLKISDLVAANHLLDANKIDAGQQLLIGTTPINTPVPNSKGKQIIVVLSKQTTYAYEDGELLKTFIISSGITIFPTVLGDYQIERKYEYADMKGPGYDIKDVPSVMYFHLGYSFHGAPWNHNLGTPASHGCLNMSIEDALWLYNWAPLGTPVKIYP